MKTHHAKTTDEAISDLQRFLESDLYSKFRPDEVVKKENLVREDTFPDEKEFQKYIGDHFDILRKEIKRIEKKPIKKSKRGWGRSYGY